MATPTMFPISKAKQRTGRIIAMAISLQTPSIWKLTNVKIIGHIRFVEFCRTVTTDGNIANQVTEVKMAVHIGFVELCMAVTADC